MRLGIRSEHTPVLRHSNAVLAAARGSGRACGFATSMGASRPPIYPVEALASSMPSLPRLSQQTRPIRAQPLLTNLLLLIRRRCWLI